MKKPVIFPALILLSILTVNAQPNLSSSVYDWEKLKVIKTTDGEERDFFNNPTRSLEVFNIRAYTLMPGEEGSNLKIEAGFDELFIVKEGKIDIRINGDQRILGEGSVIVASSGADVYILNPLTSNAVYYSIAFKPVKKNVTENEKEIVPPLFIDWRDIEFKPSANGGRRNIMQQKTTNLKELEIHVTTLKEGLPSHSAHTHPDEEIILVRKGFVEETIKDKVYRLGPGSIIFLTNDDMHGISNAGKGECEYYAIRWLTE
jgi:uncharacterized cupin superfamily protein